MKLTLQVHPPPPPPHGVIVAKCLNFADKQKVMEAKSKLRDSAHFNHIRIFHDKPKWQRQHEANLRLMVKTLGTNKLYDRGMLGV